MNLPPPRRERHSACRISGAGREDPSSVLLRSADGNQVRQVVHGTDLGGILFGELDPEAVLQAHREDGKPKRVELEILDQFVGCLDGALELKLLAGDAADLRKDLQAMRHGGASVESGVDWRTRRRIPAREPSPRRGSAFEAARGCPGRRKS